MWKRLKKLSRRFQERQRLAEIEAQRATVREAFDQACKRMDTRRQHEAAERAKRLTNDALRISVRV